MLPILLTLVPSAGALGRGMALASTVSPGAAVSLVIGGRTISTPGLEVVSTAEHGLTFGGAHQRTEPPSLVVLHCTSAENGARVVHSTLTHRRLSVEFVIDAQGQCWQFLDPGLRHGAHTGGGINHRSVGIELVNAVSPIVPNRGLRPLSKRIVQACDPRPGVLPNDWTLDALGNHLYYRASRRVDALGLYPAQLAAVRRLVEVLCVTFDVPLELADERDYVPRAERAGLRGVLGHVQVSLRHGDPSMDALDWLR